MSIKEEVKKRQVVAMKSGDKATLSTARLVLSTLSNAEIEARGKNRVLSESDVMASLRSMIKSRQDAIVLYEKGGNMTAADAEKAEIVFIQEFLPQALTEAEMINIIQPIANKIKSGELKIGPAMGMIKKQGGDRIEMSAVKQVLDKLLV